MTDTADLPLSPPDTGPGPVSGSPAGVPVPAGDVPALVRESWLASLELTDCAPEDNFFSLGGNSLLVAALITRLRARLGVALRMGTLLKNPTLDAFTAAVADEYGAARAEGRPGSR
ncbi:phosphopantetheine-binding protein [Streptomyces sp. NPDC127106]|uniref:phosphopantetheine-binding protein n=1 Tax=Streptomyces sp. NPDC127106 TaxID=3345360 RepID=UPI0036257905